MEETLAHTMYLKMVLNEEKGKTKNYLLLRLQVLRDIYEENGEVILEVYDDEEFITSVIVSYELPIEYHDPRCGKYIFAYASIELDEHEKKYGSDESYFIGCMLESMRNCGWDVWESTADFSVREKLISIKDDTEGVG